MPSYCIFAMMFLIVSVFFTSTVMVSPVEVFTLICIVATIRTTLRLSLVKNSYGMNRVTF